MGARDLRLAVAGTEGELQQMAKEKSVKPVLPPDEVVGGFLEVKPTSEMPRSGKRKPKPKKPPSSSSRRGR